MAKPSLTPMEILIIIGSILVSGVSVTVFAYSTFQTQVAAERSEDRIEKRLDRIEELQISAMKQQGLTPPPPKD